MFADVVTLRTRTGKEEEFKHDGIPYIIDVKRGLKVPRAIADVAIKQLALRWETTSGMVIDAKVYIEDDVNTPLALPSAKIEADEIAAIKNTDGLGNDSIIINGKLVKKTTIDFKNTAVKEDYSKNNLA